MKEAIRIVLKSIYDLEFLDTSHFRPGQAFHSVLRRIKEEWGTSRSFGYSFEYSSNELSMSEGRSYHNYEFKQLPYSSSSMRLDRPGLRR
uniref:Uncharacterized protein n=1 Tax=Solanum lycopersicum TaxID=4081 RepID=K4BZD3_SOLLC